MKLLIAVGLAILLTGCVTSSHRMLVENSFEPLAADEKVRIYEFADQVKRPYLRIARISVVGAPAASFESRRASARARARRIGAHALIVEHETEGSSGMLTEHNHSYLAIRFRGTER